MNVRLINYRIVHLVNLPIVPITAPAMVPDLLLLDSFSSLVLAADVSWIFEIPIEVFVPSSSFLLESDVFDVSWFLVLVVGLLDVAGTGAGNAEVLESVVPGVVLCSTVVGWFAVVLGS